MLLPCLVLSTANVILYNVILYNVILFLYKVIPTGMEGEREVREPNSVMPRQAATAILFLPNLGRLRLHIRAR